MVQLEIILGVAAGVIFTIICFVVYLRRNGKRKPPNHRQYDSAEDSYFRGSEIDDVTTTKPTKKSKTEKDEDAGFFSETGDNIARRNSVRSLRSLQVQPNLYSNACGNCGSLDRKRSKHQFTLKVSSFHGCISFITKLILDPSPELTVNCHLKVQRIKINYLTLILDSQYFFRIFGTLFDFCHFQSFACMII